MEPKDLKNSEVELSGAANEPETVNDQNVTEVADEQNEVTVPQEAVEKPVTEPVETPVEDEVRGIEASAEAEVEETVEAPITEPAAETEEPVVEEPVAEEAVTAAEEPVEVAQAEEPVVAEEEVKAEPPAEIKTVDEVAVETEKAELPEVADADSQEEAPVEENPTVEMADYSTLNAEELIDSLRHLLETDDVEAIKDDVDAIKIYFFRIYRANIEAQKAAFAEAGGDLAEFKAEPDPLELELRNMLKQYQDLRGEHNKKVDESKETNLQKKYEIIEEIKALINNKESINKTFHDFRELQNRWREIGLVPQAKLKDLWETYHHHVENFYDFIKINKELRDLDLKKNLEIKIEICEKTEELLVEPSIIKAFNVLQKYHEQWREVGPVPRDKKDELWIGRAHV